MDALQRAHSAYNGGNWHQDWRKVGIEAIAPMLEDAPVRRVKTPQPIHREIYDAYPRHVAPRKAMTAILNACEGVDPKWLLGRVLAYREAVGRWSRAYRYKDGETDLVPHPASWFNDGRYNDDPAEWNPGPGKSTAAPKQEQSEPEGWVDAFLHLHGDKGYVRHNEHSVERGNTVLYWSEVVRLKVDKEVLKVLREAAVR